MREQNKEIKYFTQQELLKFFNIIEKSKDKNKLWLRDLCLFNLGYFLGLRGSEIGLIKVNDIKENGEIFVKRLKGSNSNTLRLDDKRKKLLKKYIIDYKNIKYRYGILDDNDYLFKSKNGKQLNFNSIWQIFKKYVIQSGIDIKKLHPHTLKHSIGVHLSESGIDIKDLQFYLGHKSINNTLIYFQYTTSQLNHFYNKLEKNYNLV